MSNRYRLLLLSLVALAALALAMPCAAAPGDTIRVRAFDSLLWKEHGGENRWVSFPDSTKRYEKILMHFRLICPTGGCGEWDYTMSVFVQRRTGEVDSAGEVIDPVEIGRFITPYGKYFRAGRGFDWVYDVTDYASLLRDSVEIRTFYDGWSQGSIYVLDFELVEGIPARDVFRIENLYTGGFGYGDPNNSIENALPERTITVDPLSTNTTLKITTSGHGFGGTDNAGEFADKTHMVEVNGQQRYTQRLWREDCGQNPVYPQAGTWYYQRAGWCPGDIVHPDFFDLTPYVTPGQTATVDYNMQPYVNEDLSKPASYIIHAQVLYATGPNFTNNVAIEEVQRPTEEFRFHRMNPICADASPVIVIRNRGGAALTRAVITYGVEGGAQQRYDWNGNLAFMKTTEVTLPALDLGSTPGRFVVSVSEPNGAADEYPRDNSVTTTFDVPKRSSGTIFLSLTTDDFFDDPETTNGIAYMVMNTAGDVLYTRDGFEDRTVYRDTFRLPNGCYQFAISDSYFGDGLIPIRGTAGRYSLRDDRGTAIVTGASNGPDYLAGFGDREVTSFVVNTATGVELPDAASELDAIAIFPNPSSGRFTIDLGAAARSGLLVLTVTSLDGRRILGGPIDGSSPSLPLDLSAQPAGTYLVRIDAASGSLLRKIIVERH
jgi:hypothetical protein